ncbi:MAG: MiaB/RimO family radical SAM methylthiotransferase [Bacteroidales bacterium]
MSVKYHIITLGCQMNLSDTERVRSVLDHMGYVWTDNEEEAGLLGILACSVRQKAIDKVYTRIHKWNQWKNRKNLLTFVSGCMLPADKEKFLKLFDLVFTMNELPELPDMIRQYGVVTPAGLQRKDTAIQSKTAPDQVPALFDLLKHDPPTREEIDAIQQERGVMDRFWDIAPSYASSIEAFVPIQNGCDKFCTFCAVPYTRGREVSRPSGEILAEVKYLIDNGYRSITLLGQNVNSYGLDRKGEELSFAGLLDAIGKMGDKSGKEFWVYFTSPHPRDMGDDVILTIAKYNCLANQIHLPLQSGSDQVLVRMNRKHTVQRYRHIVEQVRKLLPEATLFTDIIVGFTGETREQFEETRKACAEFKYNMAYIAMYSPRPGAVSSRWEDNVPKSVKKERLHILNEDVARTALEWNRNNLEGCTVKVLVTGHDRKGFLSGHTEGKIVVRLLGGKESWIGRFMDVEITSVTPFSVAGKAVNVRQRVPS